MRAHTQRPPARRPAGSDYDDDDDDDDDDKERSGRTDSLPAPNPEFSRPNHTTQARRSGFGGPSLAALALARARQLGAPLARRRIIIWRGPLPPHHAPTYRPLPLYTHVPTRPSPVPMAASRMSSFTADMAL